MSSKNLFKRRSYLRADSAVKHFKKTNTGYSSSFSLCNYSIWIGNICLMILMFLCVRTDDNYSSSMLWFLRF